MLSLLCWTAAKITTPSDLEWMQVRTKSDIEDSLNVTPESALQAPRKGSLRRRLGPIQLLDVPKSSNSVQSLVCNTIGRACQRPPGLAEVKACRSRGMCDGRPAFLRLLTNGAYVASCTWNFVQSQIHAD